jgi:RNA polymerase sigma factor (TIGR02999 family)
MRGQSSAAESLCQEILPELYRIAAREIGRSDRFFAPLSKTELVNELWVRSLAKGGWQIEDRRHFFAIAARVMRHLLIDSARKRLALQRGSGHQALSLDDAAVARGISAHDDRQTVEIGILMERLETASPRAAQVVDLHYFCGYTFEETAQKTDLSVKQVRAAWDEGKKLLRRALLVGSRRGHQVVALPGLPGPGESKSLTTGRTNAETSEGLLTGSNS